MKILGEFKKLKALVGTLEPSSCRYYCDQILFTPDHAITSNGVVLFRVSNLKTDQLGQVEGKDLRKDIRYLGLSKMKKCDHDTLKEFDIDTNPNPAAPRYPEISGAFLSNCNTVRLTKVDLKRLKEVTDTLIALGESFADIYFENNGTEGYATKRPLHFVCNDCDALLVPLR